MTDITQILLQTELQSKDFGNQHATNTVLTGATVGLFRWTERRHCHRPFGSINCYKVGQRICCSGGWWNPTCRNHPHYRTIYARCKGEREGTRSVGHDRWSLPRTQASEPDCP